MKIAVIGHLCLDCIRHADGRETRSYGGIFFSVATLANLLGPAETVMPVFGVGKADYEELIERLKSYPNVDTSGVYRFGGPTNHVELMYSSLEQRVERSQNIAEPIPMKKIRPFLTADMILVNMISGFDITIETLDEIRMDARDAHTPMYLDVHSLTLGIEADFTRFHRPVELWRRWLFMLHAVQMNDEEAAILTAERLDEAALARHTLALNTKALLITRGARGCTAFIDDRKHVGRTDIEAVAPADALDPTGCGDVFAAAYCARYMSSRDVLTSVRFANTVAGFKAHLSGSEHIDALARFRVSEPNLLERA